MTALIIFIIMLIISVAACIWCSISQNKLLAKYKKPTKRQLAKIVEMRELMNLELDEALSLTYKEMKS